MNEIIFYIFLKQIGNACRDMLPGARCDPTRCTSPAPAPPPSRRIRPHYDRLLLPIPNNEAKRRQVAPSTCIRDGHGTGDVVSAAFCSACAARAPSLSEHAAQYKHALSSVVHWLGPALAPTQHESLSLSISTRSLRILPDFLA